VRRRAATRSAVLWACILPDMCGRWREEWSVQHCLPHQVKPTPLMTKKEEVNTLKTKIKGLPLLSLVLFFGCVVFFVFHTGGVLRKITFPNLGNVELSLHPAKYDIEQ